MSYEDLMARIARDLPELAGTLQAPRITYVKSHRKTYITFECTRLAGEKEFLQLERVMKELFPGRSLSVRVISPALKEAFLADPTPYRQVLIDFLRRNYPAARGWLSRIDWQIERNQLRDAGPAREGEEALLTLVMPDEISQQFMSRQNVGPRLAVAVREIFDAPVKVELTVNGDREERVAAGEDALQVLDNVLPVRVAVGRALGHHPQQDVREAGRNRGIRVGGRGEGPLLLEPEDLHRVLGPLEGGAPGEHAVEDRADGVHVRMEVDRAQRVDLLGRHVVGRPHQLAAVAGQGVRARTDDRRVEEGGDLDDVAGKEDEVLGLEVAQHEPGLLPGVVQRVRELHHDARGAVGRERPLVEEHRREALALQALHHDVGHALGGARRVDHLQEVAVVEAGEVAGELLEAVAPGRVAETVGAGRDHRDGALERKLQRVPLVRHRGGAAQRRDLVARNGGRLGREAVRIRFGGGHGCGTGWWD